MLFRSRAVHEILQRKLKKGDLYPALLAPRLTEDGSNLGMPAPSWPGGLELQLTHAEMADAVVAQQATAGGSTQLWRVTDLQQPPGLRPVV